MAATAPLTYGWGGGAIYIYTENVQIEQCLPAFGFKN